MSDSINRYSLVISKCCDQWPVIAKMTVGYNQVCPTCGEFTEIFYQEYKIPNSQ